ncbi:MAG: prepilin peptidase [Lachnospiraceae bacterium]|nr:prepilin peptidase [Lachnospiraceae bacterium]
MWTVEAISVLLFLIICTVIDLRKRSLPTWLLWAGSLGILLISLRNCGFNVFPLIKGAVPGVFLGFLSKITGEAVGYGDVWIILLLGIYLGIWDTVTLVCIAFFLCSVVAAGCLIRKKFRRDTRIPFVPFLTAAYVGVIFL